MNINIHIDVSKLVATLAEVNDRSKNLEPVMEEISMQMLSQTQMRFRRSQDPDGNAWAALKKSTIRQRRRGSSKPLMNTTTHIYQKLTKRMSKNFASVGLYDSENAKIGAVHNFGTIINRVSKKNKSYTITIPRRQFLGFSQKEIVKYNKMIQRYITKGEL